MSLSKFNIILIIIFIK